jgi:hypothetical protein
MAARALKASTVLREDADERPLSVRGTGYSLKASKLRERRVEVETLDTSPASLPPRARDEAIANATVHFKDEQHAVAVITNLWNEARAKFLAIGRNLREAKWRYPKAFEKTILPQLPFGKQVAYQLRTIAEAVDGRRFTADEIPQSYGAAYQLATLDEGDFKKAREEGLVRPDVQRRTIEEWKRQRYMRLRLESEGKVALLREERTSLHVESERLRDKLSAISTRLTEIDGQIAAEEGGITIDGRPEETGDNK